MARTNITDNTIELITDQADRLKETQRKSVREVKIKEEDIPEVKRNLKNIQNKYGNQPAIFINSKTTTIIEPLRKSLENTRKVVSTPMGPNCSSMNGDTAAILDLIEEIINVLDEMARQ